MSERIEVRIDYRVMQEMRPIEQEMLLIQRLKDAGIPVIGTMVFQGVNRGTIRAYVDLEEWCRVYIWEDKEE